MAEFAQQHDVYPTNNARRPHVGHAGLVPDVVHYDSLPQPRAAA